MSRFETGQGDTAFLNTLANGIRVVELLADGRLPIRKIAEETGLQRQTTYRLLHTLEVLGWVARRSSDDTYDLTTTLWALAVRSDRSEHVRERWSPVVHDLSQQTGETVHLAIYDQGASVYIGKEDGWQPIRSYTQLGGRSPAHCVATGKVLLAHQSEPEQSRVIDSRPERFTPRTITSAVALRRELTNIVDQGYAVNLGEYREEVGGIAVPVFSVLGSISAAIGFSGPTARIESRLDELLELLREATSTALPTEQDPETRKEPQ